MPHTIDAIGLPPNTRFEDDRIVLDPPEASDLTEKFRNVKVSPLFKAMLARLLGGYDWTNPSIVELAIDHDGNLFMSRTDDPRSAMCGHISDLKRNLQGVVDALELTRDEKIRLSVLIGANVTNHGADFDPFEFLGLK